MIFFFFQKFYKNQKKKKKCKNFKKSIKKVDELAKHISQLKSEETEKKAYVEGIKALYEQKKIEEILEKFANESHSLLTLPPRGMLFLFSLLITIL